MLSYHITYRVVYYSPSCWTLLACSIVHCSSFSTS